MGDLTRDDWLQALGEAATPCDPDALTIAEIAAKFAINRTRTERLLQDLVKQGRAIRVRKMVTYASSGYTRRQTAYRLVGQPKRKRQR